MINDKETIFITNSEVKTYSTQTFGSEIQFAPSERKNESHVVFSSGTSFDDVIKRLRSIYSTKLATKKIRDVFLAMGFNLQEKFCDAKDLRNSQEQYCIPDELITFFGTLFNINYATLKPHFPKSNNLEDDDDLEEMLLNDTNNEPDVEQVNNDHIKIKTLSLIQIIITILTIEEEKSLCM